MTACQVCSGEKRLTLGTHRSCTPDETLRRMLPQLGTFGVTRVANMTGLDYLGIPVIMTVRPNSRNLSVYQGKGLSLEQAKASAIMEAYEYACAEAERPDPKWTCASALDMSRCVAPLHLSRGEFTLNVELPWVVGTDLISGRSVFVPEELVTTDYRVPPRHGFGIFQSTSNGLASGNTDSEAVLHAICELIERDAIGLWRQAPPAHRACTHIDPRLIGDPAVQTLMDYYDAAGMSVGMWEVTSDIGVPAFLCVIDDARGTPPFLGRFGGAGCHPSAGVAVCRALTEAAQSRLTFIVGTRDDIPIDSYAVVGWEGSIASLIADPQSPQETGRQASLTPSIDTDSIGSDVECVLAKLVGRNIDRVVRVDLTDSRVCMPCVRVVIPGLEGMSHKANYRPGMRAKRALARWT